VFLFLFFCFCAARASPFPENTHSQGGVTKLKGGSHGFSLFLVFVFVQVPFFVDASLEHLERSRKAGRGQKHQAGVPWLVDASRKQHMLIVVWFLSCSPRSHQTRASGAERRGAKPQAGRRDLRPPPWRPGHGAPQLRRHGRCPRRSPRPPSDHAADGLARSRAKEGLSRIVEANERKQREESKGQGERRSGDHRDRANCKACCGVRGGERGALAARSDAWVAPPEDAREAPEPEAWLRRTSLATEPEPAEPEPAPPSESSSLSGDLFEL